jgi:phage gp29-like protein
MAETDTTPKRKPRKADKAIVSGAVYQYSDWTPGRIRQAERAAEQGNLRLAVQLCEWLLADDRVKATLDARLDALMGLDVTFEPAKGRRASRAVKALEADEDWWDSYSEAELKQLLRWGILLGVAPARHTWTERPDHGSRVLPVLNFWHPQWLRWDWQARQWIVRDDKSIEHVLTPGDGEWVLHTPAGTDRPWSHGLWRAIARFVLLKYLAQGDMGRASQRGDVLAGIPKENSASSDDQRRELSADLSQLAQSNIVLPDGFDLKQFTAEGGKNQVDQIRLADAAIAILIRGSNLTTEVKEGSKAATETQAKTGDGAKLKADAQALSTTLHDQSLQPWAEFNFGNAALAPWPVWPVEPEEDKSTRATMVKVLGEGLTIWDKLGFDIDPKGVQEEFGLTFLKGRSREREPDPAPAPADPAPKPKESTKKASARAELVSTGDARAEAAALPKMAATSGFVQGQLYADDLVDSGVKRGGEALKPFINEMLEVIDKAEDYESMRAAVIERWGEMMPPEQLRQMLANCMVLAEMAGHYAVTQDVDD